MTADLPHLAQATHALTLEARHANRPTPFRVTAARQVAPPQTPEGAEVWALTVHTEVPFPDDGRWVGASVVRGLGDHDAAAGDEAPPWRAEILEADADTQELYVAALFPFPGPGLCKLFPFDFLTPLTRLTRDAGLLPLRPRLEKALAAARGEGDAVPAPSNATGLHPAWAHTWVRVWGPPGTGKTHTLVDQVARLLADDPTERVLVLSTTNQAVDEVATRLATTLDDRGVAWQPWLRRAGRVRDVGRYDGLADLLPRGTQEALDSILALRATLRTRLDPLQRSQAHQALADAERKVTGLRALATHRGIRGVLATVHAGLSAVIDQEVVKRLLRDDPPFTTVVIDEAGLVGRLRAAACSLLASRRVVLVGDPQQLSPIVRAQRSLAPDTYRWLGESGLSHLTHIASPAVQRLNVQHRMHPDIRAVVSALSYDHQLEDAPDLPRPWTGAGTLPNLPRATWYVLDAHAPTRPALVASQRGAGGSRVRPLATDVLDALLVAQPELGDQEVLFVTPYRAQRTLVGDWIHTQHGHGRCASWRSSTVHREQGAEAPVVLFDTVHASSTGWDVEEWVRLVNVGLSRAQQLLLVLASRTELGQPWLRPLRAHLIPRALVPRGDGRVWATLAQDGTPYDDDAADLFAPQPPATPEPVAAEALEPLPTGDPATLGAQIARRRRARPVLSREQATLIHRNLSDSGPRLVRGVAGSGKTLVLARWVVRALQGLGVPEVTVVFGNEAMRPLLQHMLVDAWDAHHDGQPTVPSFPWTRVQVAHVSAILDDLLTEVGEAGRGSGRDRYEYEAHSRRVLAHTPPPRFHALFLDEAQDLGHDTLALLLSLVHAQPDGRRAALLFYDNAQNLYGRGTPKWKDLGLDLRGRSDVMRESFRSTRPNVELALGTLDRLKPLDTSPDLRELMQQEDADGAPLLDREDTAHGSRWHARYCVQDGQPPSVRIYDRAEDEVDALVRLVRRLVVDEHVRPADVRVVTMGSRREDLGQALRRALSDVCPVDLRTARGWEGCRGVVVTTPHSFKGHDAEIVLVPAVEQFCSERRGRVFPEALYVALTRARTRLVVTGARDVAKPRGDEVIQAVTEADAALRPA